MTDYKLIAALVGLARAAEGNEDILTQDSHKLITDCLLASEIDTEKLLGKIDEEKRRLIPMCYGCSSPCGKNSSWNLTAFEKEPEELRRVKEDIILALRGIAKAELPHEKITPYILKALYFIGLDSWTAEGLKPLLLEAESLLRET